MEEEGESYLSRLKPESYRLTWVGEDGGVFYDTQADAGQMENHKDRTEIQDALKLGQGQSSRYSSTLMEKTLYFARRLKDGSVLRISVSRATAWRLVLGMLQPVLMVLAAALLLSGLLAGRLSKKIVEPLNHLDLEPPLDNECYEFLRCSTASTGSTKKFSSSCASCASARTSSTRSSATCRKGWCCWTKRRTC